MLSLLSLSRTGAARGLAARALSSGAYTGEVVAPGARRILVTGATGQVGTEMVPLLREMYGEEAVIASDIRQGVDNAAGKFLHCDVLHEDSLARIVLEHGVDTVVHLAGVLSAVGERSPELALRVNNLGFRNVLTVAKANNLRIFAPSTIAVFGPSTPKDNTPDDTICQPTTVYGIAKLQLELLGTYYHRKFGIDFRSLRFPGVVSNVAAPGGGTTDWACSIFYDALKTGSYTCFVTHDTAMPMMYMDDCLKASIGLMNASPDCLKRRVYNLAAVSFTPEELANSIRRRIPNFKIEYAPDERQAIAGTWPRSIDDSIARDEWGWQHDFGVDEMVDDMLRKLEARLYPDGGSEHTVWED